MKQILLGQIHSGMRTTFILSLLCATLSVTDVSAQSQSELPKVLVLTQSNTQEPIRLTRAQASSQIFGITNPLGEGYYRITLQNPAGTGRETLTWGSLAPGDTAKFSLPETWTLKSSEIMIIIMRDGYTMFPMVELR